MMLLVGAAVALQAAESSRALRLHVPEFLDGMYDLEVVLYYEDGSFHNGYALLPQRDNLAHMAEVRPSRPVAWEDANGNRFTPPDELRGNYAYRNQRDDFQRHRAMYEEGKIRIVHPVDVPVLQVNGGRITGTLDIQIFALDSDLGGRNRGGRAWRMELDLNPGGNGTVVIWEYSGDSGDDFYGADQPRRKLPATASWNDEHWQPKPGSELAPNLGWPQAGGPLLSGAAQDFAGRFVNNLHDARLVWVSEDALSGDSGTTRGEFAMRTFAWTGYGNDVFGSPAVADGRVFLYSHQPDVKHLADHPVVDENNPFYRLGVKPSVFGENVDTVYAFDARTGRRLWRFTGDSGGRGARGKGTDGITPLVVGDNVIVRGVQGLYALNAASGEMLWQHRRIDRIDLTLGNTFPGSSEVSPVLIDGVVVMVVGNNNGLIGLNPDDGSKLWMVEKTIGNNQLPVPVELDGKTYIITVGYTAGRKVKAVTHMIDPLTGEVLWTSDIPGHNHGLVIVQKDVLAANLLHDTSSKKGITAGIRISRKGLSLLWQNEDAVWMNGRHVPVGYRGILYADSRQSGFRAFEIESGKEINNHPLIPNMTHGSHNWSWVVAGNDRVFSSGMLMFSDGHNGFHRLPGRLSVDLRGGYVCPVKPALVDGRIFMRLENRLVCYDLRRDESLRFEVATLRGENAMLAGDAMDLRLRFVSDGGQGYPSIAFSFPRRTLPNASLINNWVAYTETTLDWRATPMHGFTLDKKGLRGGQDVIIGWHNENWALELERDGTQLTGKAVRSVPGLDSVTKLAGNLFAHQYHELPDGGVLYQVGLAQGIVDRHGERQDMYLGLTVEDGKIVHAFGAAGRIGGNIHEADTAGLVFEEGKLSGTVTLLLHRDRYSELTPGNYAMIAEYEIAGKLTSTELSGTYKARAGIPYEREISISGTVEEETWENILKAAGDLEL